MTKIPAPQGDADAPLKALIFDSLYDAYKGVIVFCRVIDGTVKKGTTDPHDGNRSRGMRLYRSDIFGAGQFIPCDELSAGMVGYITASHQECKGYHVLVIPSRMRTTHVQRPLPGYKKVNPMVYCGLYPADGAKYPDLERCFGEVAVKRCIVEL